MKYNISVPGRDNSTRSHCLRCLFHLHKGGRPVQIRSRSKSFLQERTCKQDKNYDMSLSLFFCRSGRVGSQHRAWTPSWRWQPRQEMRSGLKSVTSSTSRWVLYEFSIFCPHHHHQLQSLSSSPSSSSRSSWSWWPQVALLKEERSNLLVENEDLCEKVRAAQTLSRKVLALRLDDGNVANHLKAMKIFAPGLCESAPVWNGAGPHQGRVREAAPCLREHQGAHQRHGGQAEARGWWPDWEGDDVTTTTRQDCRLTIWK